MDNSVKSTTPVCRLGIRGDIRCAHLGHAKYMLHKNNGVTFPNPFVEDDTFTEITVGKTWRGILNGVCLHGNVALAIGVRDHFWMKSVLKFILLGKLNLIPCPLLLILKVTLLHGKDKLMKWLFVLILSISDI